MSYSLYPKKKSPWIVDMKSLEKQIECLQSMEDARIGNVTIKTFQHLGGMENIFQLDKCNKLDKK